jgi:hypothetical protein
VVQYSENRNPRLSCDVKDEIWETRDYCAAHIPVEDRVRFWEVPYRFKPLANRREELVS